MKLMMFDLKTYYFPNGSFSLIVFKTFISNLAASLYLSTFLIIFNANLRLSLKIILS